MVSIANASYVDREVRATYHLQPGAALLAAELATRRFASAPENDRYPSEVMLTIRLVLRFTSSHYRIGLWGRSSAYRATHILANQDHTLSFDFSCASRQAELSSEGVSCRTPHELYKT